MTPTKGEPLVERMMHTFGDRRIRECFDQLARRHGLLNLLTEEARDDLIAACIRDHKSSRRFAAASRKHYRESKSA